MGKDSRTLKANNYVPKIDFSKLKHGSLTNTEWTYVNDFIQLVNEGISKKVILVQRTISGAAYLLSTRKGSLK